MRARGVGEVVQAGEAMAQGMSGGGIGDTVCRGEASAMYLVFTHSDG